jgi:hypothetical protein
VDYVAVSSVKSRSHACAWHNAWDSSVERHWLCCIQVFTPGTVDYVALISRVVSLVLSSLYNCVSPGKVLPLSGKTPEHSLHAEISRSERPPVLVTCIHRLLTKKVPRVR